MSHPYGFGLLRIAEGADLSLITGGIDESVEVVASWSMYPAGDEPVWPVWFVARRFVTTRPLCIDGHAYHRRIRNRRKRR